MAHLLAENGYEVREAATGNECLQMVEQTPDIVILDVYLPDTFDYDVCRQIKITPGYEMSVYSIFLLRLQQTK